MYSINRRNIKPIIITLYILLLLCVMFHAPESYGEKIKFNNGDVIEGEIISESAEKVTVEFQGGTIAFNKSDISEIIPTLIFNDEESNEIALEIPTESPKYAGTPQHASPSSHNAPTDTNLMQDVNVDKELAYFIGFFGSKEAFLVAVQEFKRLAKEQPDNMTNHYQLGLSHFYLKEYNDAISELSNVIAHNPNDIEAIRYLGYSHYRIGNVSQAISNFKKRLKVVSFDINTRTLLAESYNQLNDLEKARNEYQILLKNKPHDKRILLKLADICSKDGDEQKANEYREQAQAIATLPSMQR